MKKFRWFVYWMSVICAIIDALIGEFGLAFFMVFCAWINAIYIIRSNNR